MQALPVGSLTVALTVNTTLYPNYADPGASYAVNIDLTPRVQIAGGVVIIVKIL